MQYKSYILECTRDQQSPYNLIGEDWEEYLKSCVIFCICETWHHTTITRNTAILDILSEFEYIESLAVKEKSLGRANGGLLIFYKPEVVEEINIIEINSNFIALRGKINYKKTTTDSFEFISNSDALS